MYVKKWCVEIQNDHTAGIEGNGNIKIIFEYENQSSEILEVIVS